MSKMPFSVTTIRHPRRPHLDLLSVEGPGFDHRNVLAVLGEDHTVAQLNELCIALNLVFVMGRRAAQSEMRHALGIRVDGYDLKLMGD